MLIKKGTLVSLPAIFWVAVVTQVPFAATIILSVVRWKILRPDLKVQFAGIENFLFILTRPSLYYAIFVTIRITILALLICFAIGLVYALLLNRAFPGVRILRTLFLWPFFIMDVVVGLIWKNMMLHPSFGVVGTFFTEKLGLPPIDFFGSYATLSVVWLVVWQWAPFFELILLAGFQSIDSEILESAELDGAGFFCQLVKIKIPVIAHHIEVALMLGLIFILKAFGLVFVATGGGPGSETTNLPWFVYKTAFYEWDVGKGAAIAVITVILTLIFITRLFKWRHPDGR